MRGKKLTVRKNEHYVERLWPDGVVSLAAVVGSNGAGKTTFLEGILHMLAEGSGEKEVPAIIIYEHKGMLCAYMPDICDYTIEGAKIMKGGSMTRGIPFKDMFYFSSYFRPYKSLSNPGEGELAGVYNATDTWKLVHDLLTYSNVSTNSGMQSLSMHLNTLDTQDKTRIALMLVDSELQTLLPKNALPQYIIISPNFSGYYNLVDKVQHYATYKDLDLELPPFERYKQGELMRYISAYFYNCAAEIGYDPREILEIHKEWKNSLAAYSDRAYESLRAIILAHPDMAEELTPMLNAVEFLEHRCQYDRNIHAAYIDTFDSDSESKIREMLHHYSNNIRFVVAHLFDIAYARTHDTYTQLSSGEMDMLKFFSRLYDATYVQPRIRENLEPPRLVLIDEAENSYHPEWQRQFVSRLLKILNALYLKNLGTKYETDFQVVLTTHSPVLLSDIPKMCINYLIKDSESGEVIPLTNRRETFGANIYELYKDSFFMENGLVGEFSYEWIEALRKRIEEVETLTDDEIKDITHRIEMIGDEVVQCYLLSLLEPKNKPTMKAYYQRKIDELGEE